MLVERGGRFLRLVRLALAFIRDLAGDGAGHVELVDVQRGLTEGRHGGVHACIAIGGAAQGRQVQRLASGDDGDVERELTPPVRRRRLGDGQGWWRGELAACPRGLGRLPVQKLVVLAAGEEQLQRPGGWNRQTALSLCSLSKML